jgi:hypothetical protein
MWANGKKEHVAAVGERFAPAFTPIQSAQPSIWYVAAMEPGAFIT